jgi:hypothetical protein
MQIYGASDAAKAPPAKDSVRWNLDSLKHMVRPMKHSMTGRIPLIAEPTADGTVWSARRCGDQCLVRTFKLGKQTVPLEIEPFQGVSVTVEASPSGATYLIAKNGSIEKVEAVAQ